MTGFDPLAHVPAAMLDAMASAEAREQRQWELEQAERAERAWERQQQAERAERMTQYLTGHSSQELQMAQAMSREAREARFSAAASGAERAIILPGGDLLERKSAVAAGDEAAAQLARARTGVRGREFMRQQVAELQRRQAQREEARILRQIERDERGEISR